MRILHTLSLCPEDYDRLWNYVLDSLLSETNIYVRVSNINCQEVLHTFGLTKECMLQAIVWQCVVDQDSDEGNISSVNVRYLFSCHPILPNISSVISL